MIRLNSWGWGLLMDEDNFKEKIEALYKQRQEFGCPTMKCSTLQDTIFKEGAANSYELCLGISALLLFNKIEISNDILTDLIVLVSKNMIKYSTKCATTSFEVCQACSTSQLMDSKDIQ